MNVAIRSNENDLGWSNQPHVECLVDVQYSDELYVIWTGKQNKYSIGIQKVFFIILLIAQ